MKNLDIYFILVIITFSTVCQARKRTLQRKPRKTQLKPDDPNEDCIGIECQSPSAYPGKYIDRLVRKKKLNTAFGQIFEPTSFFEMKFRSAFEDDDNDNGENVCPSKEITVFPTTAKDEDLKMRFIVNTKENKQGITYQICVSKESFIDKLLLNYYFFCKQNYSTVRLLYLTEDGNLEYGKFPVPSACVCSYKILKK
ncbi:hypothetical protein HHI36_012336 [Cryptolaemus montrouzieri]|uniref:Spaetzle domain-containing protein n=1 Tax=Cryptolaemus montrouzieri TaxID=559131 RepID=A0ABD2NEE6_9CUCU